MWYGCSLTAKRDTGQSITVRKFLLGLYNGCDHPFDLTSFRGLDSEIFNDCILVLKMDATATVREIHEYVDEGETLFSNWSLDNKNR
jgi:hypothetical protein